MEIQRWIFVFMISNIRYFFFAGVVFLYCYVFFKEKMINRKIQAKFPKHGAIYYEIFYSLVTSLLLATTVAVLTAPAIRTHTYLYLKPDEFGWTYFFASILGVILIHDTYFYWMHRAIHHPVLFRYIHRVHHHSTNPTPWASFSFHPIEGILEIIIIPMLTFVFPLNPAALGIFILFMTAYNVYGHSGFEIYPAWFNKHPVFKWLNTSVNHNMHHKYFKGNYGLYFRFWDEWMGTTHQDYDQTFEKITEKKNVIHRL